MDKPAVKRSIYLLSPKDYGAETIAVTFAKTSRSPLSFKEIADELTEADAVRFHEKWVVGYGHASVAEHAVLHLAFENISRLAMECLQSNRLASYTEKSTRYQQWDPDCYCQPPELERHPLIRSYQSTCRELFALYAELIQPAIEHLNRTDPVVEGEPISARARRQRSTAIDSIRYLLPSAALANVGLTANARVLAHALRKMLSHPLAEVRAIGAEALHIARAEAPTLIRYVEPVPFWDELRTIQSESASHVAPSGETPVFVRLLDADPGAEDAVLTAMLYACSAGGFEEIRAHINSLLPQEKPHLLRRWLEERGMHDALPRETEKAVYTFEVVLDQGAYYEFKRHRMMTQLPQPLTAALGYETPRLIEQMGAGARYREAMGHAGDTWQDLAVWNGAVASYVVPNGYRRRLLLKANLRQLAHFCELRSTGKAHFAIREIALGMAEQIRAVHPTLGAFIRLPAGESADALSGEFFSRQS
ncbi:MAG: FAD-dependent thymidylate synthase [Anaerolineales bacterium]|nr:FAD-dependent thymidylate synthase [Anaerolineales bacterium]